MLAHSLLSRNKSDCQTDYKLRNFGNRNYLHAAANIQLFIVGIKISKMEKMDSNLFSPNEILEEQTLTDVVGGKAGNTDVCCDTEQATTVRDEQESCADTVNNGTDFWADVVFVWP